VRLLTFRRASQRPDELEGVYPDPVEVDASSLDPPNLPFSISGGASITQMIRSFLQQAQSAVQVRLKHDRSIERISGEVCNDVLWTGLIYTFAIVHKV
jgi:hypothetical protein